VAENKLDLMNKIKVVEESNSKIERDLFDRLNKIDHKFQKIDQSIESRVHKDEIFEINEKVNKMCLKDDFDNLESKVFPMLNDVIKKISI